MTDINKISTELREIYNSADLLAYNSVNNLGLDDESDEYREQYMEALHDAMADAIMIRWDVNYTEALDIYEYFMFSESYPLYAAEKCILSILSMKNVSPETKKAYGDIIGDL